MFYPLVEHHNLTAASLSFRFIIVPVKLHPYDASLFTRSQISKKKLKKSTLKRFFNILLAK